MFVDTQQTPEGHAGKQTSESAYLLGPVCCRLFLGSPYVASGHMVTIWPGPCMSEHCGCADILGPAGHLNPLNCKRGKSGQTADC